MCCCIVLKAKPPSSSRWIPLPGSFSEDLLECTAKVPLTALLCSCNPTIIDSGCYDVTGINDLNLSKVECIIFP
jgi:hypothetical protein